MPDERPAGAVLIGAGMIGGTYLQAIASLADSVRLAGVVTRSADTANAFAERAEEVLGRRPGSFATAREAAAQEDVDFAILATPPDARIGPVADLAELRCPILMEKPVARTLAEAESLVALCEASGVPLGIVLQHRVRPAALELLRRIRSNTLGALQAAEIAVPWWRPQTYYDEPGRGTFARDGGGVLINQAIHTLDLALQFTGPVRDVVALSATTAAHDMEAEDFVSAGLTFASGAPGSLLATTAAYPGRTETIRLHFAKASVELRSNRLGIDHRDGRVEEIGAAAASGAGADPTAMTSDWHAAIIADFATALREGRPPMIPGRDALDVHRLIFALEAAARTGRRTALPEAS